MIIDEIAVASSIEGLPDKEYFSKIEAQVLADCADVICISFSKEHISIMVFYFNPISKNTETTNLCFAIQDLAIDASKILKRLLSHSKNDIFSKNDALISFIDNRLIYDDLSSNISHIVKKGDGRKKRLNEV